MQASSGNSPPATTATGERPKSRTAYAVLLVVVLLVSFAWQLFWLWDQTFFSDDYRLWLPGALQSSWTSLTARLFAPPNQDWGFLDRPVIHLFYKLVHECFELRPFPYFVAKCAIFAALAGLLFVLTHAISRASRLDERASLLAATVATLLFVPCEPVFLSMLWLCDFEVLAQTAVVACLVLYLRAKGGRLCSLLPIVLIALVGAKAKPSARIIPLLLLLHLLLYRRKRMAFYLPALVLLFALALPWAHLYKVPLPPLLDFSAAPSCVPYSWKPVNGASFTHLLLGGPFRLRPYPPNVFLPYGWLQHLFPFGLLLPLLAGAALLRRATGSPFETLSKAIALPPAGLAGLWLLLTIALFAGHPLVPPHMAGRYLLTPLLPTALLTGLLVGAALCAPRVGRPAKILLLLLLLAQTRLGLRRVRLRKRGIGYTIVLLDKVRTRIEARCKDSNVVLCNLVDSGKLDCGRKNRYFCVSDKTSLNRLIRRLMAEPRPLYAAWPLQQPTKKPLPPESKRGMVAEVHQALNWYRKLIGPPLGASAIRVNRLK